MVLLSSALTRAADHRALSTGTATLLVVKECLRFMRLRGNGEFGQRHLDDCALM